MTDLSAYVGLPVPGPDGRGGGVHCWGLVRRVYAEVLGIELPAYEGVRVCAQERAEIEAIMAGVRADGPWRPVADPQALDLVHLRVEGRAVHVGLYVAPGRMLHAFARRTVIEPIDRGRWHRRVLGCYRHEARP